jgi:hypothetical protein
VAGAVDIPVLQYPTLSVGVDRAGIAVATGYLPAMHHLSGPCCSNGLFDSLRPVVGMHGAVAVAVKDNGRDHRAARKSCAAGGAPLTHRGERRRHVGGGSVGQAGMDSDRRVEIAIGSPHDGRSGAPGRKAGDEDALGINRISASKNSGNPSRSRTKSRNPCLMRTRWIGTKRGRPFLLCWMSIADTPAPGMICRDSSLVISATRAPV